MKIKNATKYICHNISLALMWYYIAIASIFAIDLILSRITTLKVQVTFSGGDISAAIFLFVLGLNVFKDNFRFFSQTGISRKTTFASSIISGIAVSTIVAIVEFCTMLLSNAINGHALLEKSTTLMNPYLNGAMGDVNILLAFAWHFLLLLACFSLGYFITVLYYRMSKGLKVAVSVGVPCAVFIVLPILESYIPGFHGFSWLLSSIAWLFGFNINADGFSISTNLERMFATFSIATVACFALTYLLSRRATLKEA